ncbi:uncharacterized protein LOC115624872 [Scaptodrosophila lebanonensis]|uniref:Uncharacterized protein LOC115624872 n=1 Tax=Drosophila lebanonensis TaxID=7225 RepID=A0A6J2TKN0_DROLE|nr:uncharacterized protein LOC115624872 [Scaptodrosophila lebanonensis]
MSLSTALVKTVKGTLSSNPKMFLEPPYIINSPLKNIEQGRQPYHHMIEQILQKVAELENTLYEDQQQELKLRVALEQHRDHIAELKFNLDTEKHRNARLVQLLGDLSIPSSDDSEIEPRVPSTTDIYRSISPLLMQQRYDELAASHNQSRRQLAKKGKALQKLKCQLEQLQIKYDHLFSEYRNEQKRFEKLCARYLHTQIKKKQEVYNLKDALGYASECIFHAQAALDGCGRSIGGAHLKKFCQNFDCFMGALRNCCCVRKLQELQKLEQNNKKERQPEYRA